MPSADIIRSSPIIRSARVMQCEGMFDVPPATNSEQRWSVVMDLPEAWSVGAIVGPSGSGKSTIAREMFGANLVTGHEWAPDKSILDGFPIEMGIKDVIGLLSSVGFSSPPAWLRPFRVLSNGEQFRVTMARALAETKELCVVDEFTSVVDRTVAKVGSAAIAKTVRRSGKKLIVCSCHYDVLEWLEPDWVYQPHAAQFDLTGRSLRRPPINLEIRQVRRSAWEFFKRHHYMTASLHRAAVCFVAFFDGQPAAFTSYLHFPHAHERRFKREHRTVVLPDFQGVGIGNRLSEWLGEKLLREGWRFVSTTSAPGMIWHRAKSALWRTARFGNAAQMGRESGLTGLRTSLSCARLTAGFEFLGEAKASQNGHQQLSQGVAS